VRAAWKLRIGVYGLLLVVAVLVLTGRPAESHDSGHVDHYSGFIAQGARLEIDLTGGQPNVSFHRHGSEFAVHEWPDPRLPQPPGRHVNLWLHGNLNPDIHRIDGEIRYFETGVRGACASGPIRFGVSR
jgi:hypothetical protein